MAWPPPALPTNRTNATDQWDNHVSDHNGVNAAMNDTTAEITANNAVFDRGDGSQPVAVQVVHNFAALYDSPGRQNQLGNPDARLANVYRTNQGNVAGTVNLHSAPGSWQQIRTLGTLTGTQGTGTLLVGQSHFVIVQPASWKQDWYYGTPTTTTAPPGGVCNHADNSPDQMLFNKIGQGSVDRTADLLALQPGDTISVADKLWIVEAVSDSGTYVTVFVRPAEQAATDEQTVSFLFTGRRDINVELGLSMDNATGPDPADASVGLATPIAKYQTRDAPYAEASLTTVLVKFPGDAFGGGGTQVHLWARCSLDLPAGATVVADLGRSAISALTFSSYGDLP